MNVSRVVVGDNNGKPVGIITGHDLLPASTLLITDKSRTPYIYAKQYRLKGKDKNNKVKNESRAFTATYSGVLLYGTKEYC
jgi:CBS domain-containing protein